MARNSSGKTLRGCAIEVRMYVGMKSPYVSCFGSLAEQEIGGVCRSGEILDLF
jgi:hypothetical protein